MIVLMAAIKLAKLTKRRDGQTDRQTGRQADSFMTAAMSVKTPIFIMAKPEFF